MKALVHPEFVLVGASSRQESSSIPQRDPALTKFSDLLEISDAEIRYWLCRRAIKAGTETIAKPMTKIEVSQNQQLS